MRYAQRELLVLLISVIEFDPAGTGEVDPSRVATNGADSESAELGTGHSGRIAVLAAGDGWEGVGS